MSALKPDPLSTPVSGPLAVTPLYAAGDQAVWWDGASWNELDISSSDGIAEFLYLPSSPTTVFSGVDYRGNTLFLDTSAADIPVYLNGVKLLMGLDYSVTSSSVTMLLGAVGPPNTVEIVSLAAVKGDPGAIGPQGLQGNTGATGPQGVPGGAGTFVESTGATVTLSSLVAVNLTNLLLPAGDWTVDGSAYFDAGTALISTLLVGANTAVATLPSRFYYSQISPQGALSGGQWGLSIPQQRLNLTVPATVYLVTQASFGPGSTVTGTGHLMARGYS